MSPDIALLLLRIVLGSLDRLLGLAYPNWLLPGWLVLMAAGAALALGVRTMQAPKAGRS